LKEAGIDGPSPVFMRSSGGLSKAHTSIVTQLRTGHAHLNRHWWRIGLREGPDCDECGEEETVKHFVMECRGYRSQRQRMKRAMGKDAEFTLATVLGTEKGVAALIDYVQETRRWTGFMRGIRPI